MMTSQNLKPLIDLQSNASSFFNQFQAKYQAHMQCKINCSQCCHVDLSIFEGEAFVILDWVKNLDKEKKQELKSRLNAPPQTSVYNKQKACAFLRNNQCTIYDARPIICRTQGVVLQYKTIVDKSNTEIHMDVCPLNFTTPNLFPEPKAALDLDRLNSLQSIAENFIQNNYENSTPLPKNKEGRVELKKLVNIILKLCQ